MLPIHFYFIIALILLQVAATCAFFVHVAKVRLLFTQSFQGQARAEGRELAKQSQARAEERELAMNQNERAEVKERELAPKAGAVTGAAEVTAACVLSVLLLQIRGLGIGTGQQDNHRGRTDGGRNACLQGDEEERSSDDLILTERTRLFLKETGRFLAAVKEMSRVLAVFVGAGGSGTEDNTTQQTRGQP